MTTRSGARRLAGAIPPTFEDPPADAIGTRRSIVVERIWPELDGGRHPIKRVVGDRLLVTADIFADGHDLLDAVLMLRAEDEERWTEASMRQVDNDRWSASAELLRTARHRYTVEAWRDAFGSLLDALRKKRDAGVPLATELSEGVLELERALDRAEAAEAGSDAKLIRQTIGRVRRARSEARRADILAEDALRTALRRHPDRRSAVRYEPELEVIVDRERARCAAWYELFPRSQGRNPRRPQPTTLRGATWRLPDIAAMGFDVVYLPPLHPIGTTNRKGRNNALRAKPGDVGSPYAIGSQAGGHDAVADELGGLPAFARFRDAVEANGMELAIDLAIQASPDHPYVREHPDWFRRAPDGTIKYAENPPKKYQDIYPIDFFGEDADARAALWLEWRRVVLTWVERGVRIFRVDNPHTKPLPFWAWLIGEVQRRHPDVIFLSEAFTRPKMMRALAKIGFTQSYTYFTWRETRDELRDYLTELTQSEMREYFRGNLFTNTPDINPHHLDHGRDTFAARFVLASTLSSLYGIYSGFELCENARLDAREEYLDSEKYQIRTRDWNAPGNIKALISAVNRLRREWGALQLYDNLRFEAVTGERTLFYRKALPDGEPDPLTGFPDRWRDPVYLAVNCDPRRAERAILHPDLPAVGIGWDEPYRLIDLLSGKASRERGADLAVMLGGDQDPFRIFTIRRLPQ